MRAIWDTVGLLGEGRVDVSAAQPRFEVGDGDLPVECRDRCGHHGRRIALDDDGIGAVFVEDGVYSRDDAAGDAVERLVVGHEVEVDVGDDVEDLIDLVEHFTMLGGDDDDWGEPGMGFEGLDHRGDLDRLGAGAVDDHDLRFGNALIGAHAISFFRVPANSETIAPRRS